MLTELRLSGLGVIEDAALRPHPGLTALTGETGAGKTMVVTALGLITGGRADSSRVRSGAERAVVEARVEVAAAHPATAGVLAAGGHPDDDGSLLLVRSVSADGRSRAHAGGRSVPLALLTELTEPLVAVHGQSEAISLLQPAQQRAVLDRYAQNAALLGRYRVARQTFLDATADLRARVEHARERALREQMLRLGVEEIDRLAPQPGEDAALVAEARRLENADTVRSAAEQARDALFGDDDTGSAGAAALTALARRALAGTGDGELAGLAEALAGVSAVLSDTAGELSGYLDRLDADPERLEQLLQRQAALKALTRRYGADIDAVLAWRGTAVAELAELDSSEEALAGLRRRRDEARRRTGELAAELSAGRAGAAERLSTAAGAELAHLALGRAALAVRVTRRAAAEGDPDAVPVGTGWCTAGPDGVDSVDILLRAHSSAPELPVARGASGGELSRVMLALEVTLAAADPVGTLVFDEVDAGVGGRAATEIGRRLARLARTHQVIVVTHLAQVAAFADRHVVVSSAEDGAIRVSSLVEVAGPDRETELARMLGGTDGATARAHAAELLDAARTEHAPPAAGSARRRTPLAAAPRS